MTKTKIDASGVLLVIFLAICGSTIIPMVGDQFPVYKHRFKPGDRARCILGGDEVIIRSTSYRSSKLEVLVKGQNGYQEIELRDSELEPIK